MVREADLRTVRRLVDEGAALVEVLPEAEYAEEHLPGAISPPLKRLDAVSVPGWTEAGRSSCTAGTRSET